MARSTLAAALLVALAGAAAAQADDRLLHLGEDAPGTVSVTKAAGVYTLRFTGDEVVEYQIDLNDPAVQRGRIRVRETQSDAWPLWNAGVGYRDVAGNALGPDWLQIHGYSALVADAASHSATSTNSSALPEGARSTSAVSPSPATAAAMAHDRRRRGPSQLPPEPTADRLSHTAAMTMQAATGSSNRPKRRGPALLASRK